MTVAFSYFNAYARFISVGIGPDVNEAVMWQLASYPKEDNIIDTNGEVLKSYARKLAALLCPGILNSMLMNSTQTTDLPQFLVSPLHASYVVASSFIPT
jgi:hypothetical protein